MECDSVKPHFYLALLWRIRKASSRPFILSTYLGAYIISIFVKMAAFSVAAGLHVLLALLYLAAYVTNQFFGGVENRVRAFADIQNGMGLTSPGANLLRALFLASNAFGATCGKYGDAENPNAFAFELYGGPYAYLIIQIFFLIVVLPICEYGNSDWIRHGGAEGEYYCPATKWRK